MQTRAKLLNELKSEMLLDNFFDMADDSCIAILPHVLRAMVQLGIADQLGDGAMSVDDLAAALQVDSVALYRLLRALATVGVTEEPASRHFCVSPLGRRLCSDSSATSRWSIDNREAAVAWTHATEAVASGQPVFDSVFGRSFFTHKDNHPQAQEAFTARMRERARNCYCDFALAADWSASQTVMDIGGSDGYVLESLLQGVAHLSGILFDRPLVIDSLVARGCLAPVKDRCRVIAGDFFDEVPSGADTHLLCSVLHDWADDRATTILKNSRSALPTGGRLLIVEMLIPDDSGWHPSIWSDIGMMVLTGGRERSKTEFDELLAGSGFSLATVRDIPNSHFSLIEATAS